MSWLDLHTTLFFRDWCKTGEEVTFRQVLFSRFHESWDTLYELKKLANAGLDDPSAYKVKKGELKRKLQCFSPGASIGLREQGNNIIKQRTGLFQLDFDNIGNVEQLKKEVFKLPFIAYCSVSCSGRGFYALAAIAEPEKLSLYGDHLFRVFNNHNIKVDTSKGKRETDLRYVHYDSNMLIRENPEPLRLLEYSYNKPKPAKRISTNSDSFTHALNVVTKKYGTIAPGNRHNFVWLFCKTLKDDGVSRQAAEEYVFKHFLPESEIKTNCINGAFNT